MDYKANQPQKHNPRGHYLHISKLLKPGSIGTTVMNIQVQPPGTKLKQNLMMLQGITLGELLESDELHVKVSDKCKVFFTDKKGNRRELEHRRIRLMKTGLIELIEPNPI